MAQLSGERATSSVDSDVLLRRAHDPNRPALDTAEAARILGKSRQAVAQAIASGRLAGYGIPGTRRTRWFAYVDAVSPPADTEQALRDKVAALLRRVAELEDELTTTRALSEAREQSRRALEDALAHAMSANADLVAASVKLRGAADLQESRNKTALIPEHPPTDSR
jgi:hypothetical protein